MTRTRFAEIDERMEGIADSMRSDPELFEFFLRRYELSWLYHENALEGVVYTVLELETALAQQSVTDAAFIGLFREIRNHKAALDQIRVEAKAKKIRINMKLVRSLLDTLGAGSESSDRIDFRKDMPLHRTYFHEIAQPSKISALLQKALDACDSAEFRGLHPIQRAARLHHGFMQVYPFDVNSGLIARLLSNLILLHAGYPLPCIIHATDRQRYYESLKSSENAVRDLTVDALVNTLFQAEKYLVEHPSRGRRVARS